MVREAEEHAAEDKARREAAETRNTAEQLAYSVDKLIKDNDDKLPEEVKTEVQADVDALKTALAGTDDDAVKTAFEKLQASPDQARRGHLRPGRSAGRRRRRRRVRRPASRPTAPTRTSSTPRSSTKTRRSNHAAPR